MQVFKRTIIILFGLCVFSYYGAAWAEAEEAWECSVCDIFRSCEDVEESKQGFPHLLRGNEPSYFVWAQDEGDASGHAEFYLSFKYPLLCGERWSFDFNYNGKYDFYLNSRYSSPIISRLQNPGGMFEYKAAFSAMPNLASIKTGYFHESNGQTISTLQEYNTALLSNPNVQDSVSRGWDYIPLEFKFAFESAHESKYFLYLKTRFFMTKQVFTQDREDTVFWEPGRTTQPKIGEYDGIRFLLSGEFNESNEIIKFIRIVDHVKLTAHFRTGYQAFNFSQRYEATVRVFTIPFHVFYINGYGRELSTYHRKNAYYGIGVEFW